MLMLETRKKRTVNTDPQRRCYYGCHFKSEELFGEWEWLELDVPPEKAEEKLTWWRDLNAYSVSVGGKPSEYRVVERNTP